MSTSRSDPFRISRRTVLQAFGASLALPFLEAMEPWAQLAGKLAYAAPPGPGRPPIRSAFIFIPNGAIMGDWKPPMVKNAPVGLPPTLAPLDKVKADVLILTGLTLDNARDKGDGPGDHARASAAFLTTAHPFKTEGKNIKLGASVDQVMARTIGGETRLPSLEIGCDRGANAGKCDSGYSCAYSSNISWSSETTPVPKEINPREVFERLFGTEALAGNVEEAPTAERLRARRSVLDLVAGEAKRLEKRLGVEDRRKLDEFTTSVREIERRIERAEKDAARSPRPEIKAPDGIPSDYKEHQRLLYDLLAIAFQMDLTRVATFMLADEGSNRSFEAVGVADGHHTLSHHGGDKAKIEQVKKIDRFQVENFAYFLEKLKGIKEGNRTLLDSCQIMFGGGISDGDKHEHHDLPILLAGRAGGSIHPGRHVPLPRETPLANLYVALLQRSGVRADSFGDSRGALEKLTV